MKQYSFVVCWSCEYSLVRVSTDHWPLATGFNMVLLCSCEECPVRLVFLSPGPPFRAIVSLAVLSATFQCHKLCTSPSLLDQEAAAGDGSLAPPPPITRQGTRSTKEESESESM